MSNASEHDKKVAAEIERIRGEEADKRQLYDRTIGGHLAPRPSPEFIRQNAGDLKTEAQIQKEAKANVIAQENAQQRERDNRLDFERSVRDHNARIEKEKSGPEQSKRSEPDKQQQPSLAERIKSMGNEVGRNVGRGKGKDDTGIER